MSNNPISMEDLKNLAYSPAGQQLMQLLQTSDPNAMQNAMQKASSGDLKGAKEAISALVNNPQVQKLLEQMGR